MVLATAFLVVSSVVHADDPWRSVAVTTNAAAPNRIAVESSRGVLLSNDNGATWSFQCENWVGRQTSLVVGVAPTTTLWGQFGGLAVSNTHGCDLRDVATPMTENYVSDLRPLPGVDGGWIAVTARGDGFANGTFRSDDDGVTWHAVSELVKGLFFNTIRTSPSGARWYVGTSRYVEETDSVTYTIRRSDDGETWTVFGIAAESDDSNFFLLDVDPLNPQRVFIGIRACRPGQRNFNDATGQKPDRVMVSEDGGATWTLFAEVVDLGGFAINDRFIWVGETEGGIWRFNHDGSDPEFLSGLRRPACLAVRGNELLTCGEEFADQFLLARSLDNGETWEPLASPAAIQGAPVCDEGESDGGPSHTAMCATVWRHLCTTDGVFDNVPNPPTECGTRARQDAANSDRDAGLTRGQSTAGCGCAVTGRTTWTHRAGLALAFGALVAARTIGRSRRRRLAAGVGRSLRTARVSHSATRWRAPS